MPNQENPLAFESQTPQEEVIFALRAHFITNLPWIVITVGLMITPTLLTAFDLAGLLGWEFPEGSLQGFVLIWYLLVFAYAFQSFLHWYFNIYILTNKRIVDIDFVQLLYKRVSSAQLENIEDVTFSVGGVAQAIFHYGDVHIQTAGTNVNFEFLRVADPGNVKRQIEEYIQRGGA